MRIGFGFDAHKQTTKRRLMLGGVRIPSKLGLAGHSDADVLLHALTDALLGALALPDIGSLFPDTEAGWKDAPSRLMLAAAYAKVRSGGYGLVNADCVLVCDRPKLAPHSLAIRESIAALLGVRPDQVGLQAKTTEGTQLATKRSMAAMVVALLVRRRQVRGSHFGARASALP